MYTLTKKQVTEMLIGCCLGDSCIEKRKSGDINNISFSHEKKQKDYLLYKYNCISKYYYPNPISKKENKKTKDFSGFRFRLYYNNSSNKTIIDFLNKNLKNENNERIIPNDLSLITPLVLYFWYLDDGYLSARLIKRKNSNYVRKQLGIALKSYSDESILKLIDYLKNKYSLNFKPKKVGNKIGWITMDNKKDMIIFFDLIKEYIDNITPESLNYKFCLFELPQTRGETFPEYNRCNCFKTGICKCRNKDFSVCI